MHTLGQKKILKLWYVLSDLEIIKEVTSKGENLLLCKEFLANRHGMQIGQYELMFRSEIKKYIKQLLIQSQFTKAECIIRNVNEDVDCMLFECTFELSTDIELQNRVLNYMEAKYPEDFKQRKQLFEFYFKLLIELKLSTIFDKWLQKIKVPNLENLNLLPFCDKQELYMDIYLERKCDFILTYLEKDNVWEYLITTNNTVQMLTWLTCNQEPLRRSVYVGLVKKYQEWPLEQNMIQQAIQMFPVIESDALIHCFAKYGTFLQEELDCSKALLKRLLKNGILKEYMHLLSYQDVLDVCLDKNYYMFGIYFYSDECPNKQETHELHFLCALRKFRAQNITDWLYISQQAVKHLERKNGRNENEIVTRFEHLTQDGELKMHEQNEKLSTPIPSVEEVLYKIRKVDLHNNSDVNMAVNSWKMCNLYEKYGKECSLIYLDFLKQYRSSCSIYKLFIDRLQQFFVFNQTHLYNACKNTISLVTNCNKDESLVIHCVAFLEMLGFDSQPLRNFLGLIKMLNIETPQSFKTLISLADEKLKNMLSETTFPLEEYGALMQLANYSNYKFCPIQILRIYAQKNDWWHFLVLIHFFEMPCKQVNTFLEYFQSKQIRDNIRRCFLNQVFSTNKGKQYKSHSSPFLTNKYLHFSDPNFVDFYGSDNKCIIDAFTMILELDCVQKSRNDKIEIIFRNSENFEENVNVGFSNLFMNAALLLKSSFVYMLCTSLNNSDVELSWATYLIISTNQWEEVKSMDNLKKHEIFWKLMETTVKAGYVELLLKSFKIFFKDTFFIDLLEFLKLTQINKDFSDLAAGYLRSYLIYWSSDDLFIPFCKNLSKNDIFLNTIKMLLIHLEYNFDSALETEKFLDCVCRSSIDEMCGVINFSLLKKIFKIVQNEKKIGKTEIINFKSIISTKKVDFEKILTLMRNQKMFDASIEIASLLLLPTCDIIYSKWIEELNLKENGVLEIGKYENELAEHSLPPEMLVNFFIHAAFKFPNGSVRKYELMKSGLEVIKKHHLFLNESFDRDQIEYDTILCFIQIEDSSIASRLDIYHSEYYEQIMLKERCVLFKSFIELKELAGVEEITTRIKEPLTQAMLKQLELLMNRLLNECDIVEALRVQELFEFRPVDLRFIVFCMALAEGAASILNLSAEDRQLLCDIERGSFGLFNKRTLSTVQQHSNNQDKSSELSNSNHSFEFEEWPPKDRNDTLKAILGIASKLKSGIQIGKRIALAYRAAMYLDKDYLDVLRTKDVGVLLKSIAEEECFHCLLVVSDIITSTNMTNQEIADFFGYEIATAVIRPRFYIFNTGNQSFNDFKSSPLWGYNIDKDLHLFLDLIPNTKLLGSILLEYCDALKSYRKYQDNKTVVINSVFHKLTDIIAQYGLPSTFAHSKPNFSPTPLQVLSHKKQNLIYVELLIKAHQCFLHECSMEGIANVLNRAKSLNSVLATAKSWSLIVKMLIGIGHYREMFYCFDTLVENEQFESLLGQFDDEKSIGLRQGILAYLREHKPENSKELFRLAALHFLMYKDLAEMMLDEGKLLHNKIIGMGHILVEDDKKLGNSGKISKLLCTDAVLELLHQLLDCYTQASENFLLDNKLLLAEKAISASELIAMQIDIAKKEMSKQSTNPRCTCVMNIKSKHQFSTLVKSGLSVPQIIILSRYFNYAVNWSEVLLWQYVIQGNRHILSDFLENNDITDSIIFNTVKSYQQFTRQNKSSIIMEEQLFHLVGLVKSSTTKYKLASILGMKSTILSLINEQSIYYLKDMNFGRKD